MVDLVAGDIDHAGGVTAGADSGVTVAGMIAGDDYAKVLELAIEYNPESSFGTCYPSITDATTLARARPIIEEGVSVARIRELAKGRRTNLLYKTDAFLSLVEEWR